MTDCHVEKFLHIRNVKKIYYIEKSLHDKFGAKCVMRRNVETNIKYVQMLNILIQYSPDDLSFTKKSICRNAWQIR